MSRPPHTPAVQPSSRRREPPEPGKNGEYRWITITVLIGAVVLLGCAVFGLVLRDGRIILPNGIVAQPGTRENPVRAGGKCTIESLEQDSDGTYYKCRSIWKLEKVLRGQDALDFLAAAAGGLPEPGEQEEYFVAQFTVTLLNSASRRPVEFSTRYFDAFDSEGKSYPEWVAQLPERFPPVAADQTIEGSLAFRVPRGDAPTIIYQAASDRYYYFSGK